MDTGRRKYQISTSVIQKHWKFIKQSVSFSDIADEMLQRGILKINDHHHFKYGIKNPEEKMDNLLYIVFGSKPEGLQQFAEALDVTGHSFVLDALKKSGKPPVTQPERRVYTQEVNDKPLTKEDLEDALQKQNEFFTTVVSHTIGRYIDVWQKELKVRIEKQDNEIQELEAEISSENTQNENIKQALGKKSQGCQKLERDNEFLKNQCEALNYKVISADEYFQLTEQKQKDSENEGKIKSLNEDVARIEREKEQLQQDQISATEEMRLEYMSEIQKCENKIKELKEKITSLQTKVIQK